jgi:hypothetical protein
VPGQPSAAVIWRVLSASSEAEIAVRVVWMRELERGELWYRK